MIYSVEDDAAIRELILYALRQAGFEAEGFEEGTAFRQAVAKANQLLVKKRFLSKACYRHLRGISGATLTKLVLMLLIRSLMLLGILLITGLPVC